VARALSSLSELSLAEREWRNDSRTGNRQLLHFVPDTCSSARPAVHAPPTSSPVVPTASFQGAEQLQTLPEQERGLPLLGEGQIANRGGCTHLSFQRKVGWPDNGCGTNEPLVLRTRESELDACILPLLVEDLSLSRQTGGQLLTEGPAPTFYWTGGVLPSSGCQPRYDLHPRP
jgi:hypothetical protein